MKYKDVLQAQGTIFLSFSIVIYVRIIGNRGMGLHFQILGSSSGGNCALIESGTTKILIDVGFSGRKIEQKLRDAGKSIDEIDAVFLTHEHSDHASGMRGLAKYEHLSFFANEPTARAIQDRLIKAVHWKIFETGTQFRFRDLTIETIRVPHDAYEPVAYIFRSDGDNLFEPSRSIAWMTDLGYIPPTIADKVRDVDLLVIEANHDVELLELDMNRPFSVKQRILGRHGHLSNKAAFEFLNSIPNPVWKNVFLAHISRDCNCLNRVADMFLAEERSWKTHIVDPDGGASFRVNLGV